MTNSTSNHVQFNIGLIIKIKFFFETSTRQSWNIHIYVGTWGKTGNINIYVVLCGLSSRQTAAACGVTWIFAVNIFHFFPSTKIPIPNSLCDSLSCEKGKSKEFRRYEARQRFHTIEFSDLNLSPYYQVLGSPVRSMRF